MAEQMASALDAAHEARIIHRDFKSSNVVLLPSQSSLGHSRVVVTDFGLALGMAWEDASESWRGGFIGTPHYMSPEQVSGEAISPASDIYAFGVVLYELATGRLPFFAETALAAALQRLHKSPPPPRTWAPELEPHWDGVLLRCLARLPEERFATAAEAVALLREKTGATITSPSLSDQTALPPQLGHAPMTRRSVAVLAPHSLWARVETAWLSTALAELLSAELATGGQVRVLSGEEVARMRRELVLPETESMAADTLRRIRTHSGVDLVLTGSYLALGHGDASTLRIDLRLQDALTGEAVIRLTEVGTDRELLNLLSRVGGTMRERLGLTPLTSEQFRQVRRTLPDNPEVTRLYAEGLASLRAHDLAAAVKWLEQAIEREPSFALAHSALAAAYQHQFLMERAKVAAHRAFKLSEGLPREDGLLVRARHHEAQAEWTQAIEAYQELLKLSPDTVEYGVALASAQASAGRIQDALATVEELRRLPPPIGNDARIELAVANAKCYSADFAAGHEHAAIAVERARRAGQRGVAANSLVLQAAALRILGHAAQAVGLMGEAERLFNECGNQGGTLRAMVMRAIALWDLVRLREAESVYATVIRRASGFRGSELEADILANASHVYCHLGDLDEGHRLAREAMDLYRRLELIPEMTLVGVQLGMVRRYQGALAEARSLLEQGAHAAREAVGNAYVEGWAHHELGMLLLDQGELSRARSHLERSLALRQDRGLRAFTGETQLSLATLTVAEERPEEALSIAEQALANFVEQHNPTKEGLAHAIVAQVLLAQEDPAAALEAIRNARRLAGQSESFFLMAEVALTSACWVSRHGTLMEREETAQQLLSLVERARAGGLKGIEFQARLVLAELAEAGGSVSAPTAYLDLAREASQLGYTFVGSKAEAAARR